MPIVLPNPRQELQAPTGELKENSDAVGGRKVKPVLGLIQCSENRTGLLELSNKAQCPRPISSAFSSASLSRFWFLLLILMRS